MHLLYCVGDIRYRRSAERRIGVQEYRFIIDGLDRFECAGRPGGWGHDDLDVPRDLGVVVAISRRRTVIRCVRVRFARKAVVHRCLGEWTELNATYAK